MSNNDFFGEPEIDRSQADYTVVGRTGTALQFLDALDGGSVLSALRQMWLDNPERFVRILVKDVMDRDRQYNDLVHEVSDLEHRLGLQEQALQRANESFEGFEEHYNLALTVAEAAAAYIATGDDSTLPERFDDLAGALSAFDSYEGPVQVDAMAGGRAAVSAVPPYEGADDVGATEESSEEVPSRPALSIVPDQD